MARFAITRDNCDGGWDRLRVSLDNLPRKYVRPFGSLVNVFFGARGHFVRSEYVRVSFLPPEPFVIRSLRDLFNLETLSR